MQAAVNGINQEKIKQIKAQIKEEAAEQKKRTSLVIALSVVVAVLFISLVGLNRWQRKQRKKRMDSMVEVGVQWDKEGDGDKPGVEIKTINAPGAAGGSYGSAGGGAESEDAPLIGSA